MGKKRQEGMSFTWTEKERETAREIFSKSIFEFSIEFYAEQAIIDRQKESLLMTKTFFNLWNAVLVSKTGKEHLDDLEALIAKQSNLDWGDDTECKFNRADRIVEVSNKRLSKFEILTGPHYGLAA
jgi:hypothetical protein